MKRLLNSYGGDSLAFGIRREELVTWKREVQNGNISFLTHYWYNPEWKNYKTVTKVGCSNIERLAKWGEQHGLEKEWIHKRDHYPHFDLIGSKQKEILIKENKQDHLEKFPILEINT
jgi:hypothetical protein